MERAKIALNFPKERQFGASQFNVQLNPSLAATMLDALPYLADYPYGCVEQTMSRFLPTVSSEKTLRECGVDLETLRARAKLRSRSQSPSRRRARQKHRLYLSQRPAQLARFDRNGVAIVVITAAPTIRFTTRRNPTK